MSIEAILSFQLFSVSLVLLSIFGGIGRIWLAEFSPIIGVSAFYAVVFFIIFSIGVFDSFVQNMRKLNN